MARGKPHHITAYIDQDGDDPSSPWAWRATWLDREGRIEHEESGGFDGRRKLSDATAARRAKAAAGFSRTKVPVRVSR